MSRQPAFACAGLVIVLAATEFAASDSSSTTVRLAVRPECLAQVISQDSASVNFAYKLRTSSVAGGGEIVARFHAIAQGGAPQPPTTDTDLRYITTLDGPGNAISGSIPIAAAFTTGVVLARFGAQEHTTRAGAAGTFQFTAPAGTTVTLSISCR